MMDQPQDASDSCAASAGAARLRPSLVVGLDVRPALFGSTGMGRVAREALAALRRRGNITVVPWALAWRRPRPELRLPGVRCRRFPARLQTLLAPFGFHVERFAAEIDVFHHTDLVYSPVARVPEVLTLHDVLFLHGHGWHGPRFVRTVGRRLSRHAPGAAAIVVPSRRTADDVLARGLARPEQLALVPLGCDHVNPRRQPDDGARVAAVLSRAGLQLADGQLLVLLPGTREPRKNQAAMVEAFLASRAPAACRMLLVGPRGWGCSGLEADLARWASLPASERRVATAGAVDEADLGALLRLADVVAYPSLGEGFGLPVFEAMRCSRAVLTSSGTPMADAAGESVLAVDPRDRAALSAGLERLLDNPSLRDDLGAAAARAAAPFTWDAHAAALESVYGCTVS